MRRPLLDLGSQSLTILSLLIERLFVVGLLVHRLGVAQFERWSLIVATVTMLTMIDLGTQTTFSNRMSRAAHRGDIAEAIEIFRQSNTIFAALAAIVTAATVSVALSGSVQNWLGFQPLLDGQEQLVALALGVSVALKLATTNFTGVYRANLAFARGTLISAINEIFRIGCGIAGLLLFGSMAALAIAMLAATALSMALVVPLDIRRRFLGFAWTWRRPRHLTTHRSLPESLMFAAMYLPSVVLTQVPVLLIGTRAAQGVLAGYVLLRTIANVVRMLSQRVTTILGMDLGRLETQSRLGELQTAYRQLSIIVAVSFAIAGTLLWTWGGLLLHLWAGPAVHYEPLLLAIMLLPLMIIPGTQINIQLLTYGHRPGSFAAAVIVQTVGAALLAFLLPIDAIALRLRCAQYRRDPADGPDHRLRHAPDDRADRRPDGALQHRVGGRRGAPDLRHRGDNTAPLVRAVRHDPVGDSGRAAGHTLAAVAGRPLRALDAHGHGRGSGLGQVRGLTAINRSVGARHMFSMRCATSRARRRRSSALP